MTPRERGKRYLRGLRAMLAAAIAAVVAAVPPLEPLLIQLGRAAANRSRLLSGLYWFVQEDLLARLRRRGDRLRAVEVHGRRLHLDITDPTGRIPYFYDTPYEAAVTDAIVTALKAGDVFVDIGANIGYYTVLAAHVVGPIGGVIAFEPHPGARETLETLVKRNEVATHVEIVPLGLAEADGEATLFVDGDVTAHSTIEPALSPMRHTAALQPASIVPLTTLDGWMAARVDLSRRVRCIKIDVEGAEARVLAGMPRLLQERSLMTVLCETTVGSPADATLAAAGFERRRIEPGSGPYGNFLYVRP